VIRAAQLLLVLAAIELWAASRVPWVVLTSSEGLGQPRVTTLTGAAWSTALIPFAVLLLAAAVAALAVRRWPLRILAVLVALVSAGCAYLAITLWTTPDVAPRAAHLTDVPAVSLIGSSREPWGAVLTLAAAVMTLTSAVLLTRVAVTGPAASDKYASRTTRRSTVAARGTPDETMSERVMWDALDEGSDPTTDSGSEGR
jgi:uncharacterized membrane protein (TIGR02234 family)